jgi:hypothetical protein
MATKKFFDGNVLHEVELPDAVLPDVLNVRGRDAMDVVAPSAVNPTGVNPDNLLVDAAQLDNLRPTDGAVPSRKFPDPLPGTGEGAGMGQPSGAFLRDPWANNPARDPGTVETVQSGEIASALPPRVAHAASITNQRLADAQAQGLPSVDEFENIANGWRNKADIRAWIAENGGEELHDAATRAELEDEARRTYHAKADAAVASLA